MSTQTTNYKLTKPATTDKYNVTIFNANADIIDQEMKANATAAGSKQPKITGAATTITDANLTASRVVVSNASGKVAVSEVTATELGYLDGVTSPIQTQINNVKSTAEGKQNPIKAGTGISIGTDGVTIGHSNSVDGRSVGSATLMPIITFDDQGHITEVTSTPVYPPTSKGSAGQYWRSDGDGTGTWMTPSTTPTSENNTLISSEGVYNALQNYAKNTVATTLANGLMSSGDKSKLDDIEDGANKTVVDSALDGASTNPVQNKVVNESIYNLSVQLRGELAGKQSKITVSTSEPTSSDGVDGDIWIVYEE